MSLCFPSWTISKYLLFICCLAGVQPTAFGQSLLINEIMASNASISDEYGEQDDWIELYNASASAIDINGYYLSDDPATPLAMQFDTSVLIEAGGFLLLWADGDTEQGKLHLPFKLSAGGEDLLLSAPSGELVDSWSFGVQATDVSYGRAPDGSLDFFFFDNPTPGQSNSNTGNVGQVDTPKFDSEGGFYDNSITVNLTVSTIGATIYYTLDGDVPDQNALLYTGPISIDETSIVRAKAFKTNYTASAISSHGYFIDEQYTLPLISLVTAPEDMFGSDGIYANPYESGPEWERPCQVQYFKNEQLEFDIDCGIRIQGNSSVGNDKKSFRLFFDKDYGQSRLNYPMFDNSAVDEFKNLVLRAGYDDDIQDSNGTLLRDPFGNRQYERSGGFISQGNWAILTINGEYWGVYEVRESMNEEFVESHTGWNDFDMLRFKKTEPELREGTWGDWNAMRDFLENNDFSSDANYETAKDLIDIDNLVNLLAFAQCSGYTSWSYGVSTYKENAPGGKWQFTVWDMDRSHFSSSWDPHDDFDATGGTTWANFYNRALTENETFRNKLVNRTADLLNTIYQSDNASAFLNSIKGEIEAEMPGEYERWTSSQGLGEWNRAIDKVHSFLERRPEKLRGYILDYYNFSSTNRIELDKIGEGFITISTITAPTLPWSGIYFEDVPVKLKAIPGPGYFFAGWSDPSLPNDPEIEVQWQDTYALTAHFVEGSDQIGEVVINEINYNAPAASDAGDWVELYNNGDETIDVSGWYFKDESDSYFTIPEQTTLAPFSYLVLAEDLAKFEAIYPAVANVIGSFETAPFGGFKLSNKGEAIHINNSNTSFTDGVTYDDELPWPEAADGTGPSLQLLDANADNAVATNWVAAAPTPGVPNVDPGMPLNQVIHFGALIDKLVTDVPFEIEASASSGLPVSYSILSGPASIQGNVVTLDGVIGVVTIEASQSGNSVYNAAPSIQRSFEVKEFIPLTQSISFPSISDKLTTDVPFGITAMASSGLPVQFEIASGPATIVGNQITLSGQAGEVLVIASQAGNSQYLAAPNVQQSFNVLEDLGEAPDGYCISKGERPWSDRMVQLSFGNIDQISGKEGYADFTDQSTVVNAGESYPISIQPDFSYIHFDEYYRIWIDLNRDGDFEDAYEKVFEHFEGAGPHGSNPVEISGMITIPSAVSVGPTRMRVAMKRNAFAEPCETFEFGEVEDYSVQLGGASGPFLSLTCPTDISILLPVGSTSAILDFDIPTATTNCPDQNIQLTQIAGPVNGSVVDAGNYTIAFEAFNTCGNAATCVLSIQVTEEQSNDDYCPSEGERPWHERIIRVQLADLDHNSGKEGYGDFTDELVSVEQGESYLLSLTPEFSYTHFDEYYKVWIDFNQDKDFLDPGEEMLAMQGIAGEGGTDGIAVEGMINIPATGVTGTTRMRISMKRDAYPTSCELFERGEVQDYAILIQAANGAANRANQGAKNSGLVDVLQFKLYPNPAAGEMFVQFEKTTSEHVHLIIYNTMQQLIFSSKFTSIAAGEVLPIDVAGWMNGLYILEIRSSSGHIAQQKLIIENTGFND